MNRALIEQFKQKLEWVLDEQFPKGECKERGHALVLFAEAVMLFEKCFDAYAKDTKNNIKLARQCMDFKSLSCDNKNCTNESCPLNKVYDVQNSTSEPLLINDGQGGYYPNEPKGCGKQMGWSSDASMDNYYCGNDGELCGECREDSLSVKDMVEKVEKRFDMNAFFWSNDKYSFMEFIKECLENTKGVTEK